jgi:hypothetical protein
MDNSNINADAAGIEANIHELLAKHRQIAIIWSVEDVQGVRPHVSGEQAWEVLQEAKRKHDAKYGICWVTLEVTADILFPKPSMKRRRP